MGADITILSSAAIKHNISAGAGVDLADNVVLLAELTLSPITPTYDARNVRTNPNVPDMQVALETAPASTGPWRTLWEPTPGEVTSQTGAEGAKGWPAGTWRRSLAADRFVRPRLVLNYQNVSLAEIDKTAVTIGITARAVGSAT